MWFWPGTTWDPERVIFEVNRDLPDLFGLTSFWSKGIFGAVVMGGYAAAAAYGFHKLITRPGFNRKIYERMNVFQYVTMQVLLILMLLLPVKMLIRHLFRIKYIWITPWFNI
jgi:hypothetical protein